MRAYDVTHSLQDLSYLSWDETSCPSGMGGVRPKAREGTGPGAVYYKLSSYSERSGVTGWENANQLLCARVARELGFSAADCRLVRAHITLGGKQQEAWVLRSKSYRAAGERAISLEDFFELEAKAGETPLELCCRMGWEEQAGQIMLLDYLTANRGRDSSSIEVICAADGALRLAPLIGGSQSLGSAFPRQLWRLDPLADLPTSNVLGTSSLLSNLELLPAGLSPKPLTRASKRTLLKGLEGVVPEQAAFLEGSWQIIWRRWQEYARLRGL